MRMHDITEDAHGVLWIAARAAGLVRLDPLTGAGTTYQLSSDKAWAVTIDHAGLLWVGTENGLNRFDPATGRLTTYYESDGLADNGVSHILEDERGDLWVSTHNGLSRFNPHDQSFRNYFAADGLSGDEFYDSSSSFKSKSGEMLFSANGGLTAFSPREIVEDPTVPPVVITDFKIFNKESRLKTRLSHSENVLTFEFSTLSYASPERNRYRYRLEPLESQWNESQGDRRFITYALPPSEYVFRVQGSTNRGIWNTEGASVHFVILPSWWQTMWFRALCGAAFLTMMWAIYRLRVRVLERQQLTLQLHRHEISALNERLMKAHEEERIRIAGELHDGVLQQITSLTLRLGTAIIKLPPDSEAKARIKQSQKELLQVGTEIRHLSHELHPAVLQESGLPSALSFYCEEFSKVRGIPVSCATDESVANLSPGAALCLYRIAQEALGNVAKHSNARQAEVRLYRSHGDDVCLSVSDDGVGFNRNEKSGGLGLINMRERVYQLHGTFEFDSEPGHGTRLKATVPFRPAP